MTQRRQVALVVGAALFFLVAMMPLSVALPMALPGESGLSARRTSGTIWWGRLEDARLAGIPLGNTDVGLQLLPLLIGEARLSFLSTGLRGTLIATPSGFGLAHGEGAIDVAVRVKPLPVTQIVLDDATVRFSGDRCAEASGRARAVLTGEIGGIALPGGMTGALRCDGNVLRLPLVGQSGMERIDFSVRASGKWRADVAVKATDPATMAKLSAAGFAPGPGGLTLTLEGAL